MRPGRGVLLLIDDVIRNRTDDHFWKRTNILFGSNMFSFGYYVRDCCYEDDHSDVIYGCPNPTQINNDRSSRRTSCTLTFRHKKEIKV